MAARWLILGCGYVGRELGRRALRRGVKVGAVTRNPEQAGLLRQEGLAPVVTADLADGDWHAAAGGGYDAVINCVSAGRRGLEGYRRSYVEGQRSVVRWLQQGGAKRAVYTGSTSVYAQTDGEWVDEHSPADPSTPAAALLLEAEGIFLAATGPALPGYVLRLVGIYGPQRHYILDQLAAGETTFAGDGGDVLNLIHRDDVCSAIERILDTGQTVVPPGIYNICSGEHPLRRDIVNWLAAQLNRAPPVFDPGLTTPRRQRRALPNGRIPCRRIVAERFRTAANWQPRYPDFKSGYRMILAGCKGGD